MSQVVKFQEFEHSEDNGGGLLSQKVTYNSVSEYVEVETDDQTLILPTDEWRLLFKLISEALQTKGHSF